MASAGVWGPATLWLLCAAVAKTTKAARAIADATRPLQGQAQHIPIRSGYTSRLPIHLAALLKQQRRGARWFSSPAASNINNILRRFISSERGASPRFDRTRLPASNTARRIAQFSGRASFASTLRPNLTGGAMPRTAGGYSLGGGARYFSHMPVAPAQVVHNVSQAMRAFFLSGRRFRYDGVGARGESKYRAVSSLEDEAMRKLADMPQSAPGAFIDFRLSPTITALSPLAAAIACASEASGFRTQAALPATLHTEGFLDVLSADFGRALKDLAAVYADLRRLSDLGDLQIVLEKDVLRVRFPGTDALTVQGLCDDLGIQRGIVAQDAKFDSAAGVPVALKFLFAPDAERTLTSPGGSARSVESSSLDSVSSLEDCSLIQEAFVAGMKRTRGCRSPKTTGACRSR